MMDILIITDPDEIEDKEDLEEINKKLKEEFFEKYTIYDVEGEGLVAVMRGFEEFIENGKEVNDADKLDNAGFIPSISELD